MKACTKCGVVKGLGEFYKKSAAKDGFTSACKSCKAETDKAWHEANKERKAETYKAWHEANKERKAEKNKSWHEANKERMIEYRKSYYKTNKDRLAEYREANKDRKAATNKAWSEANKERKAATGKAYREANPEAMIANQRNRRARKRNAEGAHTAADIRAIFTNQRGLCASCQIKLFKSGKNKYHVDHIMPLALGGSNWPANLQCLCPSCNLRKSAKHPDEWAKLNGKLL